AVVKGKASLNSYSLAVGNRTITAIYKGDKNFNASDVSNLQTIKVTGNLTSRLRLARTVVAIDPANGLATQTITLKNITSNALPLPVTLRFQNLVAGSSPIGVLGQTGTSGVDPLLDIASDVTNLLPGQTLTIQ